MSLRLAKSMSCGLGKLLRFHNGFIKFDKDCTLEKWGTVCVNKETMETSIPGVFAGGDDVTGPDLVVTAMVAGRKAAVSIDKYLQSK
mgnify:CR=1 FL=1